MKKCYIVGAGDFYGNPKPDSSDFVIAADGGLLHLIALGIKPNVIIGDFDSLDFDVFLSVLDTFFSDDGEVRTRVKKYREKLRETKNLFLLEKIFEPCKIITHPVEKDETDMHLAYEIGKSKGYTEFCFYGGVGGREDHTFANYCLLLKVKNDKNQAYLIGKNAESFVIKNEKIKIFGKDGEKVSVFAFGGEAHGVSVKGLKYEANNVTLGMDFPLGVSNSFGKLGVGEISVTSGALLIMKETK